jgi:hypothetical protein
MLVVIETTNAINYTKRFNGKFTLLERGQAATTGFFKRSGRICLDTLMSPTMTHFDLTMSYWWLIM